MSDFVWLYSTLQTNFPGSIIPAVPEIQKVSRFGDFVDSKRRPLEKFLNRIAAHVELSKSPIFHVFLNGNEADFGKATAKAPLSARAKEWLEGSMSSKFSIPKVMTRDSKAESDKSPKDLEFQGFMDHMAKWEPLVVGACKSSVGLMEVTNGLSTNLVSTGTSLKQWGDFEIGELKVALTNASACLFYYAALVASHKSDGVGVFEESLQEYSNLVASVKRALQVREDARVAYITAQATVVSAQAEYTTLTNSPTTAKERAQIQTKAEAVEKALQQEQAAKVRLERISDDLVSEYERFKHEKNLDTQRALIEFVRSEV
jgi:hypothetical protein